jgi:His/Glu/Gln/Arg/opine family amino acid ABC transporter permease subunit
MLYLQPLLTGFVLTLEVFAISAALSIVLGVLFAVLLDIRHPVWTRAARVYSAVFRGLPPLTILLLVFLGLPALGIQIPALATAVVAVTLYGTAYMGEIIAAALRSVEHDVRDGARALGMGYGRALLRVFLPSSYRVAAPAFFTELTELLKDTALAGTVGVIELTTTAQTGAANSVHPLVIFAEAAVVYAVVGSVLLVVQTVSERKPDSGRPTWMPRRRAVVTEFIGTAARS